MKSIGECLVAKLRPIVKLEKSKISSKSTKDQFISKTRPLHTCLLLDTEQWYNYDRNLIRLRLISRRKWGVDEQNRMRNEGSGLDLRLDAIKKTPCIMELPIFIIYLFKFINEVWEKRYEYITLRNTLKNNKGNKKYKNRRNIMRPNRLSWVKFNKRSPLSTTLWPIIRIFMKFEKKKVH